MQDADDRDGVARLYEDRDVADSYMARRMQFAWQRCLHQKQVTVIQRELDRRVPTTILEVAPGPGRLTTEIEFSGLGVAVENSPEMLRIASERVRQSSKRANWKLLHGDAFKLTQSVAIGTVDFAFSFRLIRHFATIERLAVLREMASVLRPQGILMFDVVNETALQAERRRYANKSEQELAVYDKGYTKEEFVAEMQGAGFAVRTLDPVLNHFRLQSGISYRLHDRWDWLAHRAVSTLERLPSTTPLEWIATCERVSD